MRNLLLSTFKLAYQNVKFNFGPYTNIYAWNYLGCSLYLVARMEILTRFLLCWAVSYLLPGFSSYIRSLHPVFGWLYRCNLIPPPLGKLRILFPWSDSLCKLNLGLWIHTMNSSSLLQVSEASFIRIHKICFVRFYLPRESTQETRRMALGRLGTRRKKIAFSKSKLII